MSVGERLLARLLELDQGVTAEPEFGSAAADGEALDPAPAPCGSDVETRALAVAVASGLIHVADKDRGHGVEGMPTTWLALRGACGMVLPTTVPH